MNEDDILTDLHPWEYRFEGENLPEFCEMHNRTIDEIEALEIRENRK